MYGSSATSSGGGIYLGSSPQGVVANSILWGSVPQEIGFDFLSPTVVHSDVQGGFAGTGNIDADPLFVDAAAGDLHLASGSPCIDAADGAWAPPFDADGNLRVDDPTVADTGAGSPSYADIGAYEYPAPGGQGIVVTAPSGGEEVPLGADLTVTWQHVNVGSVDVELSRDGGETWESVAASVDASAGSFTWTVTGPDSLDCVVRLSDASDGVPACESTGLFAIGKAIEVTDPNGGETWVLGASQTVRWRSANVQAFMIEISRNNGASWETVVASTEAASGWYSWEVTDGGLPLAQRGYLFRVSEAGNPAVTDTSDSPFTIWDGVALRVDIDAPAGGDGLDWAGAFRHPQDAVDVADIDTEIWVAEGTYVRRGALDTVVLGMGKRADIYGGFAGSEGDRALRDPVAHPTVLDGENVCYHVVTGEGYARLDGFTVTRGNASGASPDNCGAGMYNDKHYRLVVANCVFTQNVAADRGGAVYNYYANVDSWPKMVDCVFSDNTASHGGGAWNRYGAPVFSGCTFTNSTATVAGDGLGNSMTDTSIAGSVFDGNTAPQGAGVYTEDDAPTLTGCVFLGNAATVSGGALYNCAECDLVVTNCTFSLNSAPTGGAIRNDLAYLIMTNSILWDDSAGTSPEIHDTANIVSSIRYSCIQGGFAGEGNVSVAPVFADPPGGDLRLSAGSPCIDAADGSAAPGTDRDGNALHDDTGLPNVGAGSPNFADIGAYEFQGTSAGSLVTVVYPCSGAVLGVGSQVEIRWAMTTDVAAVKVELSRNGGGAWETIAGPAANAGRFVWTVTDGGLPLPQSNCLVRVSDFAAPGTEDTSTAFTIFSGVWYVKATAPAGGDGTSWATAFQHPQDAVDAASPGHEIWVCEGTYTCRTPGDQVLLHMVGDVDVYGGFSGVEATRAVRNWVVNDSHLSGRGASTVVVVGASRARIDGFSITKGVHGGYNHRTGAWVGTGLCNLGLSDMVVANCTFDEGFVPGSASGIHNRYSQVTVADRVFTRFDSTAVYVGYGSSATVSGCTFSDNENASLYVNLSTRSVTTCDFVGNRGGGVRNYPDSDVAIEDCLFQANEYSEGGAVRNDHCSVQVTACRFLSNVGGMGGAVFNDGVTGVFQNCIFWNNSAWSGGAIYGASYNGSSTLTNCTFAANSAGGVGGALRLDAYDYPRIANCILWGNTAPTGPQMSGDGLSGEYPSVTYTCIEGGYAGAGNFDQDPMFVNAAVGDLRLSAGSPSIDAADGDAAPATDINGDTRFDLPAKPNTGTGTPPYADMGAYEYRP